MSEPSAIRLPWESALYDEVRRLEARLQKCAAAYARVQAENIRLRKNLHTSNERAKAWTLRQQAWARERNELLTRLGERG